MLFSKCEEIFHFLPAHALGAFFGSVPQSGIAAMAKPYCCKEAKAAPLHERSPAA
jgi:hypothetical protein